MSRKMKYNGYVSGSILTRQKWPRRQVKNDRVFSLTTMRKSLKECFDDVQGDLCKMPYDNALCKKPFDPPTAVAGEADNVSSVSASACHIGGPIYVNPGELALVYGRVDL